MTDAVFGLVLWGTSREVIGYRGLEVRYVIGMNHDFRPPLAASGDDTVGALPRQRLHLRRKEQVIRRNVPVPMPLIRSFHCERIALLAVTQRALAGLDSP